MVKRAFLDEESVEAAIVPLVGENWISDTKVKGFGLRLYNSKAGPTKRFAIRATDISGKSIRKNFKDQTARYNHSIEWKWDDEFEGVKQPFNWNAPLGLYAKQARDWAFDEIRTLKGLTTLESENDNRRENAKRILNDITLERAAQALVSNYRKMKMSTSYVDRVDKLFTQLVSTALKTKPIRLFSKDDANDLHICCEGLTGNKRTLVPFLGRIFLLHQNLVGGRDVFGMTKGGQFIQKIPDKSFKIDDGNIGKVRALLASLEVNRLHWQQSYLLRIYFETNALMSKLMSSRWDQMFEWSDSNGRTPNRLVWKYGQRKRQYEILGEAFERLLDSAKDLATDELSDHSHVFPSRQSRQSEHIRSVEPFWTSTLYRFGLSYVSPRIFRIALRDYGTWRMFSDLD